MKIRFASHNISTQMKFAVAPYIRHATAGREFEVVEIGKNFQQNISDQWFLRDVKTG